MSQLAPFAPSTEVYLGMVDAAADALVVVDGAGVICLANAQAERMFGLPRDLLVGEHIEALVPLGLDGTGIGPLAGGAQESRVAALVVRPDGESFPAEITLSPLPSADGVLTCAAIRDVSERVAMLAASERIRDELIATVSHELRTPLTSILGYTEILVDMGEPAVSETASRLLSVVRRNAERELKLVEDLLTLAVFGGAGITVESVPTDLGLLVRTAMSDLAGFAAENGVSLNSSGLPSLWVSGDSDRLSTVVRNLITNAVKFSESGTLVDVRLALDGLHGVIEVQDQGLGLESHELPQIFNPLYRSPSAVLAQVPGAGLGLPIVKGIVDAHAGEIDLASEPGLGTTVQVRLPLAEVPARVG